MRFLAILLLLSFPASAADFYEITPRDCGGHTLVTINAPRPDGTHVAMTFQLQNQGSASQEAAAFHTKWLKPKLNDPTAPAWDRQGMTKFTNRIGWIIIGHSPVGEGCG